MEFCRHIVSRKGSEVIIRDSKGKLWRTHRVKKRHNNRKGLIKEAFRSVRYIPIERVVEKGDWLFTCSMEPKQFSHWDEPRNYKDYAISDERWDEMSEKEKEKWMYEDFTTIGGSDHSRSNCGLSPISDEYAKFFIDKKLWELYDLYKDFELYEEAVKKVCEAYKVKYEGI